MAQNIGTLISAAIRPNDSLDPIASAYASEIRGGLHTTNDITDRDNIIIQRREWGMMCYVINTDTLYQLKYNYVDTNIMNNSNWVVFSGGPVGGSEWIDSVITRTGTPPVSPSNGDRYLITVGGASWSGQNDKITQWNSTLNNWEYTIPTNGMSVRVDDEDNAIYKYEGVYPSGIWDKEELNQVRFILATSSNGTTYTSISSPSFGSYVDDILFLVNFATANSGTVSININSVGDTTVKKLSGTGLADIDPGDLIPGYIYSMIYDGVNFQVSVPNRLTSIDSVRYFIPSDQKIIVPTYSQYWVYGDLTIEGELENQGQVIIANGGLVLNGGSFTNMDGYLSFVSLDNEPTYSYLTSSTISFDVGSTYSTVSADIITNSITTPLLSTTAGSATAGYILSNDGVGNFIWTSPISGNRLYQFPADPSLSDSDIGKLVAWENNKIKVANTRPYSDGQAGIYNLSVTNLQLPTQSKLIFEFENTIDITTTDFDITDYFTVLDEFSNVQYEIRFTNSSSYTMANVIYIQLQGNAQSTMSHIVSYINNTAFYNVENGGLLASSVGGGHFNLELYTIVTRLGAVSNNHSLVFNTTVFTNVIDYYTQNDNTGSDGDWYTDFMCDYQIIFPGQNGNVSMPSMRGLLHKTNFLSTEWNTVLGGSNLMYKQLGKLAYGVPFNNVDLPFAISKGIDFSINTQYGNVILVTCIQGDTEITIEETGFTIGSTHTFNTSPSVNNVFDFTTTQIGIEGVAKAVVNMIVGELIKIENGIAFISSNNLSIKFNGTSFTIPDDMSTVQFSDRVLIAGDDGTLTTLNDALSYTPSINNYDSLITNGYFVPLQNVINDGEKIAVTWFQIPYK